MKCLECAHALPEPHRSRVVSCSGTFLGADGRELWHLPCYAWGGVPGPYHTVEFSAYCGTFYVAALQYSGLGVGPEPGWHRHHMLNQPTPSRAAWEGYYRFVAELEMMGWAKVLRIPLLVPVAALLARPAWRALRARRDQTTGSCDFCGYNLTGNVSGRCPECGTPIIGETGKDRAA